VTSVMQTEQVLCKVVKDRELFSALYWIYMGVQGDLKAVLLACVHKQPVQAAMLKVVDEKFNAPNIEKQVDKVFLGYQLR